MTATWSVFNIPVVSSARFISFLFSGWGSGDGADECMTKRFGQGFVITRRHGVATSKVDLFGSHFNHACLHVCVQKVGHFLPEARENFFLEAKNTIGRHKINFYSSRSQTVMWNRPSPFALPSTTYIST